MQLESKLPLPWWSWARLLKKAPACKRCEQKWKSKWLWASELGKWTMKGWNTEATELTSYLETFGPLTDSTLSRSNYGCLLSAMDCASPHERKVEVSTPGAFSFFIFLFFFKLSFTSIWYLISSFGTSPFSEQKSAFVKPITEALRLFFLFCFLKKGEVIPEYSLSINIMFLCDRVFKFRINKG